MDKVIAFGAGMAFAWWLSRKNAKIADLEASLKEARRTEEKS